MKLLINSIATIALLALQTKAVFEDGGSRRSPAPTYHRPAGGIGTGGTGTHGSTHRHSSGHQPSAEERLFDRYHGPIVNPIKPSTTSTFKLITKQEFYKKMFEDLHEDRYGWDSVCSWVDSLIEKDEAVTYMYGGEKTPRYVSPYVEAAAHQAQIKQAGGLAVPRGDCFEMLIFNGLLFYKAKYPHRRIIKHNQREIPKSSYWYPKKRNYKKSKGALIPNAALFALVDYTEEQIKAGNMQSIIDPDAGFPTTQFNQHLEREQSERQAEVCLQAGCAGALVVGMA
eukprot:Pgem_evm1s7523